MFRIDLSEDLNIEASFFYYITALKSLTEKSANNSVTTIVEASISNENLEKVDCFSPLKAASLEENLSEGERNVDSGIETSPKPAISSATCGGVRAVDQLKYLADLLNFEVELIHIFVVIRN